MTQARGPAPFTHYCLRGEHEFKAQTDWPDRCSNCHSLVWDIPKGEPNLHTRGIATGDAKRTPAPKRTDRLNERPA